MGRKSNQLSAIVVQRMNVPGRFGDGGGLYLQVARGGSKSWLFRFMHNGRAREMGLGPFPAFTLAEAREKAFECRRQLAAGRDPLDAKCANKREERLQRAKDISFDACAVAFLDSHSAKWSNPKHRQQWENTLRDYVSPVIGKLSVQAVDTSLVVKILQPIWREKTETASRIRGRIESILSFARVREWRSGENPARWRGHLDQLLPRPNDVAEKSHHAALAYTEMGAFMSELKRETGIAPLALQFVILTGTRTNEGLGAKWDEFDLDAGTWTVPGIRMKHGRDHRVPLSPAALAILNGLKETADGKFVFPGARCGKPLSNMSLLQVIKVRMGRKITTHGFRSTFRDWAAECTTFQNEVVEMALAHTIENKVEAAYRRGDLFQKRRELMRAWAEFCETGGAKILSITG